MSIQIQSDFWIIASWNYAFKLSSISQYRENGETLNPTRLVFV